jgi:hypothetical protein
VKLSYEMMEKMSRNPDSERSRTKLMLRMRRHEREDLIEKDAKWWEWEWECSSSRNVSPTLRNLIDADPLPDSS